MVSFFWIWGQHPLTEFIFQFGTQGSLAAFQPNYTSVQALLYCIRNNGSLVWTRFGTTSDPNALLTVTQVKAFHFSHLCLLHIYQTGQLQHYWNLAGGHKFASFTATTPTHNPTAATANNGVHNFAANNGVHNFASDNGVHNFAANNRVHNVAINNNR
jgi:hypothetical protein